MAQRRNKEIEDCEETLEETAFNIPAYYLKAFDSYDIKSVIQEINKPALLLNIYTLKKSNNK